MSQKSLFFPLQGGLDQTTQAIVAAQGRAIAVSNYEAVDEGYARIAGYERYDGHPSPTDVWQNASDGEAIADREAARALIGMVPGSGPVRGVWRFNDKTYAWRDNADATRCLMWVSSPTGWQAVDMGYAYDFTSGGAFEIQEGDVITGATSGATATVRRVVLRAGSWALGTAAGELIVSTPVGTFVPENLNVGANPDVATFGTIGLPEQYFPAGGRYSFVTHNFYGATGYRAVYGCNGVSQGFTFGLDGAVTFIRTGMPDDKPIRVAAYKQHLFFAFRLGSVQNSATGDPIIWNAQLGAAEISTGDEITDFQATSDALAIMGSSSINVLTGNDSTDFVMTLLTDEDGAAPFTTQRIGTVIYQDSAGFRSITATQAYGSFKIGTLTPQIQPTLNTNRKANNTPVASVTVRGKTHYRLFYKDGSGISIYLGRKAPEPMTFAFPNPVMCVCSSLDSDDRERAFFGSSNGFVYEMEVGTSFDGAQIEAFIILSFNHLGSPRVLKRWHKAILEMVAVPNTEIRVAVEFDYAGNEQPAGKAQSASVAGGGGFWDAAFWDQFYWDSPLVGSGEFYLEGQGKNMALIISTRSTEVSSYVLQGVTYNYTIRGQVR